MKAYIAVTGLLFLALAAAHVMRIVQERHLARDPWFIATTVIAIGMSVWAVQLVRRRAAS